MSDRATILDSAFLQKLESLSLVSRRLATGQNQGARRSARHGASVEFADFREYTSGDDLRYVDWKAYGRLEKLFLKLFVEEEDLNLHVLLDTSASMVWGANISKLDYARRVAAALGYIALSDYDRVSVAGFSTTLGDILPPMRGRPGVAPFFRFLDEHTRSGAGGTHFGDALAQYAARVRGGGIAVVLSDFWDAGYAKGLRALMARRFQIVLLHVLDPEEVRPTLTGDLRLVDSETGEAREVSLTPHVVAQYQAQFTKYCGELEQMASRYGMDYVRTVTDVPFEDVILKFLRRRRVLR